MLTNLREEAVAKSLPRNDFDCGEAELNQFLQRYARQSHEKGMAKTYLTLNAQNQIVGFYSLTLSSLPYQRFPTALQKRLGYHDVPLFTLARLAVDSRFQGQGVGGMLLVRALTRCEQVAKEVGGIGLLIEAKNEQVASWYQSYGAVPLLDNPLSLFLPFTKS